MPTLDLVYRFIALDESAGAEFDKIGAKMGVLDQKTKASALNWKTFGAGVGVAAAGVAAAAVDMAVKAEQARTRLTGAIDNVNGSMNSLAPAIDALDGRMAKFGYTTTQTEDALAPLVTATKNPTESIKLMGLAADLARGRNISLADATNLLVKVETGHVALLGRYGIATKTASGATISQTQAIQRLTALYGGDASRNADTFTGHMQALAAGVEDVGIRIGHDAIPFLDDGAKALLGMGHAAGDVVGFFAHNEAASIALAGVLSGTLLPAVARTGVAFAATGFEKASTMLYSATTVASGLVGAFRDADGAVAGFSAALDSLDINPVGLGLAALGVTVGGLVALFEHSSHEAQAAKQAVDSYVQSLHTNYNSARSVAESEAAVNKSLQQRIALVKATQMPQQYARGGFGESEIDYQKRYTQAIIEADPKAREFASQLQRMGKNAHIASANTAEMAGQLHVSQGAIRGAADALGMQLDGAYAGLEPKIRAYIQAAEASHRPTVQAASDFKDLGNKANSVTADIQDLDTAFGDFVGRFLDLRDAKSQALADLASLDTALKKSHDSIALNTAAGRSASDAYTAYVRDIQGVIDKTYSATNSYSAAARAGRNYVDRLTGDFPRGSAVVESVTRDIARYLDGLEKHAGPAGRKTGSAYAAALAGMSPQARAAAQKLVASVKTGLDDIPGVKDAGSKFVQQFAQGVIYSQGESATAAEHMTTIAAKAVSTHQDQISAAARAASLKAANALQAGYAGAQTAGGEFDHGYAAGILSGADGPVNAAARVAAAAVAAARGPKGQNSGSPSKKMIGAGVEFGQGYAFGIGSQGGKVSAAAIGLSGSALAAVNHYLDAGLKVTGEDKAKALAEAMRGTMKTALDTLKSGGDAALTQLKSTLSKAEQAVKATQSAMRQLQQSDVQSLTQNAGLSNIDLTGGTDISSVLSSVFGSSSTSSTNSNAPTIVGYAPGDDPRSVAVMASFARSLVPTGADNRDTILSGLASQARTEQRFEHALSELHREGLSRALQQQILAMGPDQGLAYAQALTGHPQAIRQANRYETQIMGSATAYGRRDAEARDGKKLDELNKHLTAIESAAKEQNALLRQLAGQIGHEVTSGLNNGTRTAVSKGRVKAGK